MLWICYRQQTTLYFYKIIKNFDQIFWIIAVGIHTDRYLPIRSMLGKDSDTVVGLYRCRLLTAYRWDDNILVVFIVNEK